MHDPNETLPAAPDTTSRSIPIDDSNTQRPWIDQRQLCAELGISPVTATKWRAKAEGPPFVKAGRLVRYRRVEVEAWLASRSVGVRRCG